MARRSFFDLPSELRYQIYVEVLSSPTGFLLPVERASIAQRFRIVPLVLPTGHTKFSRFAPIPPASISRTNILGFTSYMTEISLISEITLSLLQTCRQVYVEARDILFTHNTIVISPLTDLLNDFRGLDASLRLRVRHIWLGMNFRFRRVKGTARVLKALSSWAQNGGMLRTLTLNIVQCVKDMEDLIRMSADRASLFSSYLDVLRECRDRYDSQCPGVTRRLELRVARLPEKKIRGVRGYQTVNEYPDPQKLVVELHHAFGGELWVDGRLCYSKNNELLQPFRQVGADQWQISWFQVPKVCDGGPAYDHNDGNDGAASGEDHESDDNLGSGADYNSDINASDISDIGDVGMDISDDDMDVSDDNTDVSDDATDISDDISNLSGDVVFNDSESSTEEEYDSDDSNHSSRNMGETIMRLGSSVVW